MALLVFLSLNQKWLSISPKQLYELALKVSLSEASKKDEVLTSIQSTVMKNLI